MSMTELLKRKPGQILSSLTFTKSGIVYLENKSRVNTVTNEHGDI